MQTLTLEMERMEDVLLNIQKMLPFELPTHSDHAVHFRKSYNDFDEAIRSFELTLREAQDMLAIESARPSTSGRSKMELGRRSWSNADMSAMASFDWKSLVSVLTEIQNLYAIDRNWRHQDVKPRNIIILGGLPYDTFAGTSLQRQHQGIEAADISDSTNPRDSGDSQTRPSKSKFEREPSIPDPPDSLDLYHNAYIVIDALDECDTRSELLDSDDPVPIVAISCPYPRVEESLDDPWGMLCSSQTKTTTECLLVDEYEYTEDERAYAMKTFDRSSILGAFDNELLGMYDMEAHEIQRVGTNGPLLLQDFHLIDLLSHSDRERVPERVVHAKCSGAYSVFTLTKILDDPCLTDVFSQEGKRNQWTVRLSAFSGKSGCQYCARDPRGFSFKFKTVDNVNTWSIWSVTVWIYHCVVTSALKSTGLKTMRILHRMLRCSLFRVPPSITTLSPLLFASRAMASPSKGAQSSGGLSRLHDHWLYVLDHTQQELISCCSSSFLAKHNDKNQPSVTQEFDPKTLLLATFVCTSTVAIASQVGRRDTHQPLIVALFALISGVWAAISNIDVRQFILGYLVWGCIAGVGTSWLIHRAMRFRKPSGENPEDGHFSRQALGLK